MKHTNLIKWEGDNEYEILQFCDGAASADLDLIHVKTKSGIAECDLGDYVRKNPDGTFDVLSADIVEQQFN